MTELDSSEVEYTYDDLYRLTGEARTGTGSYTRSYGYDLAGNLTTYGGSTFASYDNTNKISALSGGSISYDADGNTTAVSGAGIPSTTLTWDMRNKLLRQQATTDDLSYRYDHTGKRVLRWATAVPAVKTFYVFSGDTLIGEVSAGTPSYAYTWGTGGLVSQRGIVTNQSLWYHFGPQGETRQLTNSLGVVVDSYSYDGYGRPISSSGIDPNPFKYGGMVGYYSEGHAGTMLATHRWYSPGLSRWMSRDPIRYRGGDNLYEYVRDNPVRFTDPSGLCICQFNWFDTHTGYATVSCSCEGVPIAINPEHPEPAINPAQCGVNYEADGFQVNDTRYKIDGDTCVEINCSGHNVNIEYCRGLPAICMGKSGVSQVTPGVFGGPPKELPAGQAPMPVKGGE